MVSILANRTGAIISDQKREVEWQRYAKRQAEYRKNQKATYDSRRNSQIFSIYKEKEKM